MAKTPTSKSSFSVWQRWGIFFSVVVSIAAMSAVIVMLNYLGARYYLRFPWSLQTRNELTPQTISVLKSVTNDINVVIYYNKNDRLYEKVRDLLDEYRLRNSKISVRTVDYLADPGDAQKIQETYKDFIVRENDTNVIIFSSSSTTNVVVGEKLGTFVVEAAPNEGEREFRNKLAAFQGELYFTSAIFQLINTHPARAYFYEDQNSVHHLDGQDLFGYQKFKSVLRVNNIEVVKIDNLRAATGVPADCKLLIISGPGELTRDDVENIRRYLVQGGRLLVMFNYLSRDANLGLESLLAEWGISVRPNVVRDLKNHSANSLNDVIVGSFKKSHPVVANLSGSSLELVLPRIVGTNSVNQGVDVSAAQELAWTGLSAVIDNSPVITGKPMPVMAAVEKGGVKGITDSGPTRIIALGDSLFLDNQLLEAAQNRAFAGYAANWLVGQMPLLQGVGPEPIKEYTLRMTSAQSQSIRWIFLAGMPGGILLLGGLVWLRRRR